MAKAIRRERRLLGNRLRQLREERKLSQQTAAEKMGVHEKHLSRVESGLVNVTIATLVAASVAYAVPLVALFGEPKK